jgi:hypothetical protein
MATGIHYEVRICIFEVDNQTRADRGGPIDSIGAWPSDKRTEWHSTVEKAEEVQQFVHKAAFSPNIMQLKRLPWTCGQCAQQTCDTIKLVELFGGQHLEASCSSCGSKQYTSA